MEKTTVFMKKTLFALCLIGLVACQFSKKSATPPPGSATILSPGGKTEIRFRLDKEGRPTYRAFFNKKEVLGESPLGFALADADFSKGFELVETSTTDHDETWQPVWGEVSDIRDRHRELFVHLKNTASKLDFGIRFRAFDDGIGLRYEFFEKNYPADIHILSEKTGFKMTGDHRAWWLPGDWDTNEYQWSSSLLSETTRARAAFFADPTNDISGKSPAGPTVFQTPFTMRAADGTHMAIHEAALVGFPAMDISIDPKSFLATAELCPGPDPQSPATVKPGFKTPWRVVILAENAAGLLESKLILNLNEPSKVAEPDWIHAMKYVGIWWEMHLGISGWNYKDKQTGKPTGKHGATTENAKRYIDFAAKNGIRGLLVEGWNEGWEDWFNTGKPEVFNFTKAYPDYNLDTISAYAKAKGVRLIFHHETGGAVESYVRQQQDAFDFMGKYGSNMVKTGHVMLYSPPGEHHDGQWMVDYYNKTLMDAAARHIMVVAHEPARPTGLHRTWPNLLACEAARGNEFNAWSKGNPPAHECILPFTRLLGGPMDYTPGIFQTTFEKLGKTERVHTTVAKQLALYVTLYSPVQMAADLPENYEARPDAFQFIRNVSVDWSDTRILNAEVGEFLTIARRSKRTGDWFLGSITNEQPRNFSIKLDFLEPGKNWTATIYADGPHADWQRDPMSVVISKRTVKPGEVLDLRLASGGGAAVSFTAE